MSTDLIPLAFVMFAATYPTRALGLLAPAFDRLPKAAIAYLQLVGPAVLAALAAVAVMVRTPDDGPPVFYIGIEWVAVLACLGDRRSGAGTCCSGSSSRSRSWWSLAPTGLAGAASRADRDLSRAARRPRSRRAAMGR